MDEVEVAVEPAGVAAVADDAEAVLRLFIEAERHCVHVGREPLLALVHLPRGFFFQDAVLAGLSVIEVGDDEARHVERGTGEAAGGPAADEFEALRLAGCEGVAFGHVRLQRGGKGLAEAGLFHAEGREDVFFDVVFQFFAGDALHDVAGERGGVVGVSGSGAGREQRSRLAVLQVVFEGGQVFGAADEQVLDGFFVSAGVRHDVAHGEAGGDAEVEVLIHVLVEVDFALLDLLHDAGPDEELGDGAGAEEGEGGVDRFFVGDIGIAVAFGEEDVAVFDDGDGETGKVLAGELEGNDAVEEGGEVILGEGGLGEEGGRGEEEGEGAHG